MKNKKIILIVSFAVVIAGLGFLGWMLLRPPLNIEKALPSNAVFYARISNAQKYWKELSNSDLYKNIAAIDLPKVMAHNNVSAKKIKEIQRWQLQILEGINNPLLQKVWGKEAAIAVYPDHQPGIKSEYGFLIVFRPDLSIQMADSAGQFFSQWASSMSTTQEMYKGIKIIHIQLKDEHMKFSYVHVQDLIIATIDPSLLLKKTIDAYLKQSDSLSDDKQFASIKQYAYPTAAGIVYLNMADLLKSLKSEMSSWFAREPNDDQLSAFPAYGISFLPSGINHYKIILAVDQSHMSADLRQTFACQGAQNDSLKFVPANVIGYNWGSCYNFKEYWQKAGVQMQNAKMGDGANKFRHRLEKHLHLNIENDILPQLGDQMGGYLTDIDTNGMFPFPRMLLFVKIKDRKVMQDLLDRAVKNPFAAVQDEDYESVTLHYMSLPFGSNFDPGYCFIDDYLLIATSRQLLKKSIDAFKEPGRSLQEDKEFKSLGLIDSTKTNSVTFLKVGDVSSRLTDVLEWGNKYLSSQISMAAAYKQEGQEKKDDLTNDINEKTSELKLAESKLTQLKNKPVDPNASAEDASVAAGVISNLQKDISDIQDDIQATNAQIKKMQAMLANYDTQVDSAKLMMFNSENVFIPLLKSIGTLDLQGVKVKVSKQVIETELLLK